MTTKQTLRVGIGGPVGSGKTALVEALCLDMRDKYEIAVVTNDIYTREDAEFLNRAGALAPERIMGVETGGCRALAAGRVDCFPVKKPKRKKDKVFLMNAYALLMKKTIS